MNSLALRDERVTLPARYEAAKRALAECERVDEAQDIANKAAALAVYAAQSKDDSLVIMAQRIQARAIRRCGELLKSEPTRPGKNTPETKPLTLGARAKAAGLSVHQRNTATRVASVPAEKFETLVEAERPAPVTKIANAGRKRDTRALKPKAAKCCPTCGRPL